MNEPVRIVFLGGLGEIGRNCFCLEVDGRIIVVDCGLMFPDADMPGVDLVLPEFTYLRENADRVGRSCMAPSYPLASHTPLIVMLTEAEQATFRRHLTECALALDTRPAARPAPVHPAPAGPRPGATQPKDSR